MGDIYPLILGILILVSSLISLKLGISVTIVEILLGIITGNIGIIRPEAWMLYIASFGGILLTFLSGIEIDSNLMKEKMKEIVLIGFLSFAAPFVIIFLFVYFIVGWNFLAAILCATALSETSIAIVYSALVEKNLLEYQIGKILIGATFITNLCTAIALSILFIKPNLYTLLFYIISIIVLFLAFKYSHILFNSPILKNKLNEVEIKYIFLLLLILIFFASLGQGQAILPAFILGLLLSKHFKLNSPGYETKKRLKIVAFAFITPIFFIVGGMKVSLSLIMSGIVIFVLIFVLRQLSKFLGVYFISKKYLNSNKQYITLMMSTGLTFGLIATTFGLTTGILDQMTYSILTGVLVLSAILPTITAEKWFPPHTEDITD
ncbi:cation:proton antiporter [Methanobrevibacter sp. TMH8]|nr:cation:proton antiporter [Methanobrevibacter sp. TMH8]